MMLHIMLMFAAVGACLHAALGWLLAMNPLLPMPTEMYKCAVGLSGVLFGLIVVDTHASGSHPRSVLGLFKGARCGMSPECRSLRIDGGSFATDGQGATDVSPYSTHDRKILNLVCGQKKVVGDTPR